MINHTPLYRELYKFTNEYKNNEAKQIVNKFIFKQPSVDHTDGYNFINSDKLYSGKLNAIPKSKVFFNNITSVKNIYKDRHVILSVPFSEFGNSKVIIDKLNAYVNKSISNTNGEYSSTLESLGRRKESWNNNYPKLNTFLSTFNGKIVSKWLYGLQFNSREFYEATGIYLTIFRRKNVNDVIESSCINNNYDLGDGLNIKVCIKSSSHLEIDFIEQDKNTVDNIYELRLYNSPMITLLNDETYNDPTLFDFSYTDLNNIIGETITVQTEGTTDIPEFSFDYSNPLYKSLMNVKLTVNAYNEKSGFSSKKFDIYLYEHEFEINYIAGSSNSDHAKIRISISDELKEVLLNNTSTDHKLLYEFKVTFKEYNTSNDVLEQRDILSRYYQVPIDNPYYESIKIDPNLSTEEISSLLIEDEKNIRECLPFSLEYLLGKNTTFNISKITKVLYKNIVFKNYIPCIKYTLDIKHDTVMFFRGSKLINPTYIETNGLTYTIYLSIEDMISKDTFEKLTKMMYGVYNPTTFIELSIDDLWIVYDTDRHFIENMRYDLKSIHKYINLSTTQRYSIFVDDKDNESYIEDDNGEYIKYKDNYIELGSISYYLDENGNYSQDIPINYTGDIYRKTKTNEYLLPVNKNLDPSSIIITIEDYHMHEETTDAHYRKDPEGAYIYLNDDRYYQTYNIEDKSSLYVKINDNYFLYDETEHSDYKGSFYIRKEKGYVIPPYYYIEDVRYTKVGRKVVNLSNIFNLKYDEEIVSKKSYYMDDGDLIETKTYTKEELITEMLYEKFKLVYPINNNAYYKDVDEEYKLYSSVNDVNCELYYKTNDEDISYVKKTDVDEYLSEISQFIDMNRIYKFSLQNGEILDGGYPDTDEYIDVIDAGYATSYSNYQYITKSKALEAIENGETIYILINDKPVLYDIDLYPDFKGPFYRDFTNEIDINKNYSYDTGFYIIDAGYSDDIAQYMVDGGLSNDTDSEGDNIDFDDYVYINEEESSKYEYAYDTTDDYPVYDFNFSSPYSINDTKVKAYRIDSSYSNFYINSEDDFLAYVIPNQLINSENKLMTFLDGKFTDEYVINKSLYSRLFGGDNILSINDPHDYSGKDYTYRIDVDGEYYFDLETNSYIHDPDRDMSLVDRLSYVTYYKTKYDQYEKITYSDAVAIFNKQDIYKFIDNMYIKIEDINELDNYDSLYVNIGIIYIDSELYDSNDIVSTKIYKINKNTECYKLKNGKYISIVDYKSNTIEIESYKKYYQLKNEYNGSSYISAQDFYIYTTPYSKNISNMFMCSLKNLSLYQNSRGISYNNKIFTVKNSMDTVVYNERQLYRDIYFPPLSLKYMLFFINGKFANPFIEIITPQRFIISDDSFLDSNESINDIHIYAYNKYLYNLNCYNAFFTKTSKDTNIDSSTEYNIYTYNDTMWDKYSNLIIQNIKLNPNIKDQIYDPKDEGYSETALASLYEIFGKYILNKYDIDSDYTLYDEIREYFAPLFGEDNRMKLELLQNNTKRKYIY